MRGTEAFLAPSYLPLLYKGTSCVNSLTHQAAVTEHMIRPIQPPPQLQQGLTSCSHGSREVHDESVCSFMNTFPDFIPININENETALLSVL